MKLYYIIRIDTRYSVRAGLGERLIDGDAYMCSAYTGKAYKRESVAKRALAMATLYGPKLGVTYKLVEIET